jgi:predicted nucleic acid-binding protein
VALVGVDTDILIFWEQIAAGKRADKNGKTEAEKLRYRSKVLQRTLENDNSLVVASAVSVAELLVTVEYSKAAATLAEYASSYFIKEFDARSAAFAARLYQLACGTPAFHDRQKQRLWNDLKIIASIKAAGAMKFYSLDGKCRELAAHIIPAEDAPTHIYDLFDEQG